ncbi:MAG: TlpA family protein disulfide reductase [Myxococcales bacterium]|nr:TlpA family protein disulfide reductase [Myxococcales bacterium]
MVRRDLWVVLVVVLALALITTLRSSAPLPAPALPELATAGPAIDRPAVAGFDLPRLGGGRRSLADFEGRVVVLNFWATWCGPCREELPALEALHRELSAEGVAVVAVSLDKGSEDAVARFVAERELSFDVLHDSTGETEERYGVRFYPTTVVIDGRGRSVARVHSAWNWAAPSVIGWLRQLLAEAQHP